MNRNGFTLIEIAVVLALIAMVLVLVIPRLPSSEHEDVKTSARNLAAILRYMQERAATSGKAYYLQIEPGTDSVQILQDAADGSKKGAEDPLLQQRPVKEGIIVADLVRPRLGKTAEGQVTLPVGAGGVRVTIHLRSPDGTFWTVMAFPSSGKVKVYQGYQEDAL